MADKRHDEVRDSLKAWGFDVEKSQDAFWTDSEQAKQAKKQGSLWTPRTEGQPDLKAMRGHYYSWIELKNFGRSFPFSAIDEKKRRWYEAKKKFNPNYWLFLILDDKPPNWDKTKYPTARRAWLVPIEKVFKLEESFPPKVCRFMWEKDSPKYCNRGRCNSSAG